MRGVMDDGDTGGPTPHALTVIVFGSERRLGGGEEMAGKSNEKNQPEGLPSGMGAEDRIEGKIDRDLRDSFPASDPPG